MRSHRRKFSNSDSVEQKSLSFLKSPACLVLCSYWVRFFNKHKFMVETSNGEELMEHSPTFAESFSPQLVTFITKAWILCKLYICFDDVYRENFGFSGCINKF
jgi:hypothetical protein